MNEQEYEYGILSAWQGEVAGEVFFDTLAELADDEGFRKKWRLLARLEAHVGARLKARVGDGASVPQSRMDGYRAMAEASTKMPPREAMQGLLTVVDGALAKFEALLAAARPGDEALLRLVRDHEAALKTFAERELAGDGATSVQPVLDILEAA